MNTHENTNTIPLASIETDSDTCIPTEKEGVWLDECSPTDPELLDLVAANHTDIKHQGSINIDYISELDRPYGWAYKIHQDDPRGDTANLAGAVYVIKKGMDVGSVQIAYFVDPKYQGNGVATAAVSAVTDIERKKNDVIAYIDKLNIPSVKLVHALGYGAFGDAKGLDMFIKDKQRTK